MVNVLLFGYHPLITAKYLTCDQGDPAAASEIIDNLQKLPSGGVDRCLWMSDGSYLRPVLMIDRAKEIAAHLFDWSEGKPEEWFTLYITSYPDKYGVFLIPDPRKSIERYKIAHLSKNSEFLPPDTDFRVIFTSIHCLVNGFTYQNALRAGVMIGEKMPVVLVDTSEFSPDMSGEQARAKFEELAARGEAFEIGSYSTGRFLNPSKEDWMDKYVDAIMNGGYNA